MIVEKNARSTTHRNDETFVKTSHELDLANEAAELQRCRDLNIRTPHVGVLEYLHFDGTSNELVTKPVFASETLFNRLWNESSIVSRLSSRTMNVETVLERASELGEWLRLYHGTTEHTDEAVQVSQRLVSTFRDKLELARSYGLLDRPLIRQFEDKYYPEIQRLADPDYRKRNYIKICRVHGDFIVNNMVVDGNWQVYVLDFADTHIGASVEDIGRFYQLLWAMGKTSSFRKKVFSKALDTFLGAYGVPHDIHNSPSLKAVRAFNVIIHLISEHTAKPYISRQLLTRLSFLRISRLSVRWLRSELGA